VAVDVTKGDLLREARAFLRDAPCPRVLVLSGPAGSVRDRFVAQLDEEAPGRGVAMARIPLTLEGFEPTGPGLRDFVPFLLDFRYPRPVPDRQALEEALRLALAHGTDGSGGAWAVAFALLVADPASTSVLARWSARRAEDPGGWPSPDALVDALVAEHASRGGLLVEVEAESTLADPVCAWLLGALGRSPAAAAAFHCSGAILTQALVGTDRAWCNPLRLEIQDEAPAREPASQAIDPVLLGYLRLMALCGDSAPARPLLESLGVAGADLDDVVDRIDEMLCSGADARLVDVGYRHPGFPDLEVYRFRVRSFRHRLLEAWDEAGRADAARRARASLGSRIPVTTRAAASLFANLGELGSSDAGVGPRQRLRLWVGDEDLLGLQRLLADDVAAGRMEPATLIATARGAGPLSPAQRLAMLDAAGEPARIDVHLLRARLQLDLGRFDSALESADRGLALAGGAADDPARLRGQFLFLAARSHRGAGRIDRALEAYAEAAEEARRPSPDGKIDRHAVGACLAEQGRCHAERREWSQAVDRLEEALGCLRLGDADGQVHVDQIALVERNLARCHLEMHRARD